MAHLDQPERNAAGVLSILVFVVGLLLTVASWRTLRTFEQSQVHWATEFAARTIRTNLVTNMEWQLVGLDRLAIIWEAADPAQELWTKNAQLYIQHRPGCVAVEWVAPGGERRTVITAGDKPRALAFGGLPKSLLDTVSRTRVAMMSPPEQVSDGSRQWAVAYPVYTQGQPRGFIVSFFDLRESLDHILGNINPLDFWLGVSPPSQPEYVLPGTNRKNEQQWGTVLDVELAGTTWHLRVWPNADTVSQLDSVVDEVALVGGTALSFLVALSLYFGARTRRANRALQHEVGVREGAQEELRRTHAELEMRIERRTSELAGANALLQKEVTDRQHAQETLEQLAGRLFTLQDEERRRLARELHDGAVQNLVALAIDMGMIRDAIPGDDISTKELGYECIHLIDQATNELRTISYLLHPPYFDELGLPAALRDFTEGFATRSGIRVSLEIDPALGRLGHELELAILRVVQEALSNVHRHAHSPTATISIARHEGYVRVEIADAGRGIPAEVLDPNRTSLAGVGIASIRERVRLLRGRLRIQSGADGTTICAMLPLPAGEVTGKSAVATVAAAALRES